MNAPGPGLGFVGATRAMYAYLRQYGYPRFGCLGASLRWARYWR